MVAPTNLYRLLARRDPQPKPQEAAAPSWTTTLYDSVTCNTTALTQSLVDFVAYMQTKPLPALTDGKPRTIQEKINSLNAAFAAAKKAELAAEQALDTAKNEIKKAHQEAKIQNQAAMVNLKELMDAIFDYKRTSKAFLALESPGNVNPYNAMQISLKNSIENLYSQTKELNDFDTINTVIQDLQNILWQLYEKKYSHLYETVIPNVTGSYEEIYNTRKELADKILESVTSLEQGDRLFFTTDPGDISDKIKETWLQITSQQADKGPPPPHFRADLKKRYLEAAATAEELRRKLQECETAVTIAQEDLNTKQTETQIIQERKRQFEESCLTEERSLAFQES